MRFAILATGPSLTADQCEAVRGLRVIAVSDAYKLAPWAEALVSADAAWWRYHKPEFAGRKFASNAISGTERVKGMGTGTNSGVVAIRAAMHLGAKEVVLLGYDGHGSHFFGKHPEPLKNTSDTRRRVHMNQHRMQALECSRAGVKVWNCSPGTAIPYYPKADLEDVL